MQKRIKTMMKRERDLLNFVFLHPKEFRRPIIYLSVSGLCVGVAFILRLVA